MKCFKLFTKKLKLASALKLLAAALLVNLAGCSFFSTQEVDTDKLDDNSYPVLVIINDSLKAQVSPHLNDLQQLLADQNKHYRPEMTFTIKFDPSDFNTKSKCSSMANSSLEAIEYDGDRYVACLLKEGGYRTLAYLNLSTNDQISINLLDRKNHPRLSYFFLPVRSSVADIIASELLLWMNEQARFADLKTW